MPDDTPVPLTINRRSFLQTASLTTAAIALGCRSTTPPTTAPATKPAAAPVAAVRPPPSGPPKRYAIVGLGSRSSMYQTALQKDYKDYGTLLAICDKNVGRLDLAQRKSFQNGAPIPRSYLPDDFEKMIAENKLDAVIVTTMCSTHHEYINRAMRAGVDVITEKPLTTTAETCQKILDTRKQTNKKCRVTFNYRYSPPRTQVKDILMSGAIGDILSVDFHWLLNTFHGADYFRRWHKQKRYSGGLLIHKATHHFDLVNWWLGAVPVEVYASGKREFYTPAMAKRLGLASAHERCHTCPEKDKCNFFFDLAANPGLKDLYLENEKYDGYFRDQCVFNDTADIEDTMNVVVRYDNNVTLSYSLNAFNSWEGYTIAFNGTKGRLEHTDIESITTAPEGAPPSSIKPGTTTTIIPIRGPALPQKIWTGTGGHGGGDTVLLDDLFLHNPPEDKYKRAADERSGADSILIGVAGNLSIPTGKPIRIADLVTGLDRPDYAPMPSRTGPVPMPPRLPLPPVTQPTTAATMAPAKKKKK